MLSNIYLLFLVCLYLLNTFFFGKLFFSLFLKFKFNNTQEKMVFIFVFGNLCLSCIFIYLGIFGMLYKQLLGIIYLSPLVFLFAKIFKIKRSNIVKTVRGHVNLFCRPYKKNALVLVILTFVIFPLIPHLFLYPTGWDSVAYHLALPKMYLNEHKFLFKAWYPESGYPIGIESIFGFGEVFGEPRLSNFISPLFILMSIIYVVYGLKNRFSFKVLILAILIFILRTTFYSEVSVNPNVDYPFALFGFVATTLLIRFFEDKSLRTFVLTFLLTLFCFLIKYTGVLFILCSILTLLIFLKFEKLKFNVNKLKWLFSRKGMVYTFISLLVVLPIVFWVTRNIYYTNDPFYPYLTGLFPTRERDLKIPEITGNIKSENVYWIESLIKLYENKDNALDYLFLFDNYSLYFLVTALIYAIFFVKNKIIKYFAVHTLIYLTAISFFVGPLVRYYLPVYIALSLVLSYVFFEWWNKKSFIFKPLVFVSLVFLFVLVDTAYYKRYLFFVDKPKAEWLNYINNNLAKEKLKMQNNWEAIQYIYNEIPLEDGKILLMFDNRIYYFNANVIYGHPTVYFSKAIPLSVDQLHIQLKNENIKYIFENREWGVAKLTDKGLYDRFISKYAKSIFDNKKTVIYRLD